MRNVDDAHDAEDQRKSAAKQKQQRAVGDAIKRLQQPEPRIHRRPFSPRAGGGQPISHPVDWASHTECGNAPGRTRAVARGWLRAPPRRDRASGEGPPTEPKGDAQSCRWELVKMPQCRLWTFQNYWLCDGMM